MINSGKSWSNLTFRDSFGIFRTSRFQNCPFDNWPNKFILSNHIFTWGLSQLATASQKKIKSGTTPLGLTEIIWHIPRNAESFSSLSRIFLREVHQGLTNCNRDGATIWGQTRPIRPMVIAVFSNKVLGVLGLKMRQFIINPNKTKNNPNVVWNCLFDEGSESWWIINVNWWRKLIDEVN